MMTIAVVRTSVFPTGLQEVDTTGGPYNDALAIVARNHFLVSDSHEMAN